MKNYALLVVLLIISFVSKAQIVATVAGDDDTGNAANQLYDPAGIFVDHSGNLYVADLYNNRIQKFPAGSDTATNGITVAGGNGYGNAADQFAYPNGVFVDDSGNIYVADGLNNRVQKFPPGSNSTTNGITVAGGSGAGNAADQLDDPTSVYVDDTGNIYVADYFNDRIQKFPPGSDSTTNGVTVAGGNSEGSAADQLDHPSGLYLDKSGNLYVSDFNNFRIQKFLSGSNSLTNGVTVAGGNGYGSNADQLEDPSAVFVDSSGNIYVADAANNRVQKFPPGSTADSNAITVAGGNGNGNAADQLNGPDGIFVNDSGYIYVSDYYNNRIQKWTQLPRSITTGEPHDFAFCAGTTFTIPFIYSGTFNYGNIFIAQLSDSSGSFTNPVIIGIVDTVADSLTVTIPSNTAQGVGYRIRILSSNPALTGSDNGTNLIVNAPAPVITLLGSDSLTTTVFNSYQWLLNNNVIGSADSQIVVAVQSGFYSVYVTDSNGCSNISTAYGFYETGISTLNNGLNLKLFPNPNDGSFVLESANCIGQQFIIYDALGKKIRQDIIGANKQVIELESIPAGNYMLQIAGEACRVIRFAVE